MDEITVFSHLTTILTTKKVLWEHNRTTRNIEKARNS